MAEAHQAIAKARQIADAARQMQAEIFAFEEHRLDQKVQAALAEHEQLAETLRHSATD